MKDAVRKYFLHILIGVNQLVSTLFGGWPDETISAYVYRLEQRGNWFAGGIRRLIDYAALALFDQYDHCAKAVREERDRIQQPPENRT